MYFESIQSKESKKAFDLLVKIDRGYQPKKEEIRFLEKVTSLELMDPDITILPESIGKLLNLRTLDICGSQIKTLPKTLGELTKLSYLRIWNNQIKNLPETIGNLTNLFYLDISNNQIESLPKSIEKLVNLSDLKIWSNKIHSLPKTIGKLTNLSYLDISNNKIEFLPETIGELTNLSFLYISNNQIKSMPKTIGKLNNLSELYISNNQIESISETIRDLNDLSVLDISYTKISTLPDWIGELPNLQRLNLSGLTLSNIPESLAKSGLHFIELLLFNKKTGINLYNTTLTEQDKSIFLESPELIPSLYNREEEIQLKECRVLFLGDGGSGKTYTIRRLQNDCRKETKENQYITDETPGVEIGDYITEYDRIKVQIHFWDFGGQDILHSMHRCFLTDKTCYVVTVKTRDAHTDSSRARFWLENVTAFAPNSPILLYVNCWNHNDGKRFIDGNRLLVDFPNIFRIVYVSAKEAEDSDFRENIHNSILQMATESEIFKQRFNRRFVAVRDAIVEKGKNLPYITKEDYYKLCSDNGVTKEEAPDLLTYFNILGVCFSYHRNSKRQEFADYKLLAPIWLTNAIYSIIEEGFAQAHDGRIKFTAVQQMLGNKAPDNVMFVDENGEKKLRKYQRIRPDLTYKDYQCQYIIDVAQMHNLCYKIDDDMLFFPALCSNNSPDEALYSTDEYPQHIKYQLRYTYLPDSVVHQLMVQCYRADIALSNCWLHGLVLGSMGVHKAVVCMDDDENLSIEIWSSAEHPAYEFFEMLRCEILDVNERLNLKANEFIIDGKDKHSLISLLNATKGTGIVYGNESGKERRAADLLGLFFENWTLKFTQVQNGVITIPILPKEFHKQSKNDQAFRRALYDAYNHICPYCNRIIDSIRDMQVDHILPQEYKEHPELKEYISYLEECGFDISKPDYVENYMPSHGRCNLDKSNNVELFSILARHERAERMKRKVLKLYEKYKNQS